MPFNKPDIRQLSAVGSTVGDVYFPQTTLLLPFDGANGATTTSDLSKNNHTVTFNGNSAISTVQSKFGESSLGLDGTDYVALPSTTCDFGLGDFTVECWVRSSNWDHSDAQSYYSVILDSNWGGGGVTDEYWQLVIKINGTLGFLMRNVADMNRHLVSCSVRAFFRNLYLLSKWSISHVEYLYL